MSATIIPKKSSVPLKVPETTDLDIGEIAVNLADFVMYTKNSSDTVGLLSGIPKKIITANASATIGYNNYIKGSYDLTLPTTAQEGSIVIVSKDFGATPVIKSAGEQEIITEDDTTTTLEYDVMNFLYLIFDGTDWQLLL